METKKRSRMTKDVKDFKVNIAALDTVYVCMCRMSANIHLTPDCNGPIPVGVNRLSRTNSFAMLLCMNCHIDKARDSLFLVLVRVNEMRCLKVWILMKYIS